MIERDGQKSKDTVVRSMHVSPGYFEVLRLPIVAGRALRAADVGGRAIVVNAAMAAKLWPGQSPIGRTVFAGPTIESASLREVVGVVAADDTEGAALRLEPVRPRMCELVDGWRGHSAATPESNGGNGASTD